jgi:heme/copper-type cytochrome/quinol oxidase subunit 4
MTTSAAHPSPASSGDSHAAAPASTGVQVRCLKCNHANPWDTRFCGQCGAWLGDAKEMATAEAKRMVASHPALHEASHDRSIGFYAGIFIALGVATITEILSTQFLPQPFRNIGLFSMATVKFLLVGMFFMHLKGDKRFYTMFFVVGLTFAISILLVFQLLFHIHSALPTHLP